MQELLPFEYVKTSVDKKTSLEKLSPCSFVSSITIGKIIKLQHFNFRNFTL